MTTQLLQRHRDRTGAPLGDGGGPQVDLRPAREDGARSIDEGLEAVEQALSGDSDALLAANRQRGGQ